MECVTSFTDTLPDSASCQVLLIICIIMVKMAIATMTMKMMLTKVVN